MVYERVIRRIEDLSLFAQREVLSKAAALEKAGSEKFSGYAWISYDWAQEGSEVVKKVTKLEPIMGSVLNAFPSVSEIVL